MQLLRENNNAKYQITRYTTRSITVNDQTFAQSILIMPSYLSLWDKTCIKNIDERDLDKLLELKPELILLGSGQNMAFLNPGLHQNILMRKIGLEVMDTAAACRTFAALTAQGREVLAALILDV